MSLRTLVARHLQADASSHWPHPFLLTLDKDSPFIALGPGDRPVEDPRYLHLFVHEYWRYLLGVTTVYGFKSFAFTRRILLGFSKTFLERSDGNSGGSAALAPIERLAVRTLREAQLEIDG